VFSHPDPEVLVVGAGPCGLATSMFLAERHVRVAVIDQRAPGHRGMHAHVLHAHSLQLLDDVGALNDLVLEGARIGRVGIWDPSGARAHVHVERLGGQFPWLIALPAHALEAALERRLRQLGVQVQWGQRLQGLEWSSDRALATVASLTGASGGYPVMAGLALVDKVRTLSVRYVVGADGFQSTVRRLAHIGTDDIGAPEAYAIAEFDASPVPDGEARIVFGRSTGDALWPLPGRHCRWTLQVPAWSEPQEDVPLEPVDARSFRGVLPGLVEDALAERAPWFRMPDASMRWAALVQFQPALVHRFGYGRVWLVGDAAHVQSPLGVQGLNAGLAEAHDLASRMARVLRSAADDETLDGYHEVATAAWRAMLGIDAGAHANADADPWLAEKADRVLRALPATGGDLWKLARQVGIGSATLASSSGSTSTAMS
jgi:2-polyprenyl-6-methoxyphenol hydroxylase-like FAD-dependent oxidoreductase